MTAGHECTPASARASQFARVEVRITVERRRVDVRIRMKPSAACWDDLQTTAHLVIARPTDSLPMSEEEAAEISHHALKEMYPGLF